MAQSPPRPRCAFRLSNTKTRRNDGLFCSRAAETGVVTMSTGPRVASSAINGVVRMVSPMNAV
jgi:hypothetical protein